jgi:hypothetical protein
MTNPQPWWLTWPPAEVAAAILPLFSSATHLREGPALKAIASWFTTGSYREPFVSATQPGAPYFENPDIRAAAEAIQVLEHAGLIMRITPASESGPYIGLTRRGYHALQTNTVRQYLGLSDAPPTVSN